jgi:hypothetical protein
MHTKGPWKYGIHSKEIYGNGVSICRMLPAEEEQSANTTLVASAPDMLEALKKVLDIINPYSHIPAQFEANLIIQAAISKAEGGEG